MNQIKFQIISGELKKGDKLLPERSMVAQYNTSRITVLRALKELEQLGYIVRHQGRGTYVSSTKPRLPEQPLIVKNKTRISYGINGFHEYKYFYMLLIELFQQENPDIIVDLQSIPMSANIKDCPYMLKIASGNMPMVGEFFMHADYAALNGLIPLDNMPGFSRILESINSTIPYKTSNSSGIKKYHALPFYYTPRMLHINVHLCQQAGIDINHGPSSFEELEEWIRKLNVHINKQKYECYSFYINEPEHSNAVIAYLSYIWTVDGYKEADSKDDFIKILESKGEWLDFFIKNHQTTPENFIPYDKGIEFFMLGRIGILLSESGAFFRLKNAIYPNFEIKTVNIPPFKSGGNSITSFGDMSVGIFSSGIKFESELDAAWRWIQFMLKPEIQTMIAEGYWSFPVVNSAAYPPLEQQVINECLQAMKTAKRQYDFEGIRKVFTILAIEMQKAIQGTVDVKSCLQNSKQKILDNIY